MNILYKFVTVPILSVLVLSGCNEDNKIKKKESTTIVEPKQKIVLDEIKMMSHLRNIQTIAVSNNNNRAVGTKGAKETAEYIIKLADSAGFKKTITTFRNDENKEGKNIVVEIPGKLSNSIILVGAHYDSVPAGPGINDNASGVSVVLELMNYFSQAKERPKHTIRLAFWDSEETGVVGSKDYVSKLNEAQLKEIKAYINLDMVGTRFATASVIDADKSSREKLEAKLREEGKSEEIIKDEINSVMAIPSLPEDLQFEVSMKEFFKSHHMPFNEDLTVIPTTDLRSFAGKVPVVGIEMLDEKNGMDKYIPCYHRFCDTIDLIDPLTLDMSGKALAHLIQTIENK